jgi:hypothetical protein
VRSRRLVVRPLFRLLAASLVVVCGAARSPAQDVSAAMEEIRASKHAIAVRITEPIQLDGVLDEPAWKLAEPATGFYQQVPDEFAPAKRPTEVRFLYTDSTLYIGAMLYDDRPNTLITNDLKREFSGFSTDAFGLVLDTFSDKLNSYGFMTNVGGAMRDLLTSDAGRSNDTNWNAVWDVRTKVLPNGWSLEMAIPFKSLRFPNRDQQVWLLNVVRIARQLNERSMWAPVPRQLTHYNTSLAGTLEGIRGVQPGRNVYIKPFATGAFRSGFANQSDRDGDGGVDVKWGVTSSLSLDASWRTDFSQVEADEQQINLTRFGQFFPEKRDFFLENAGIFQIGLQESPARNDIVPFFSRRIGLSNGQPLPVIGGFRLTGRAGQQTLGVLNMQTDSFNGAPGSNYTALMLRRPLSRTMSLGGFYLGRQSSATNGVNRVGGYEFRYTPRRTFDVESFAMRSESETDPGGWAGRTGFLLGASRHRARLAWLHVDHNFHDDLGFIKRGGIGSLYGNYALAFSPKSHHVVEYTVGPTFELTTDDRYKQVETGLAGMNLSMTFVDGGSLDAEVTRDVEHLDAPFRVPSSSLTIAPGDHQFHYGNIKYTSDNSARVSGSLELHRGGYWTGTQHTVNSALRIRVDEHLAASGTFGHNVIDLPQGSFTGNLVGIRVDTSFNPRMFLNAFIQYNSTTSTWLTNVRYNLVHHPLSDIYVVWNDTRAEGVAGQRALLLKYTHLFSF